MSVATGSTSVRAASTRIADLTARASPDPRPAASARPMPAHRKDTAEDGTITRQPVTRRGASLNPAIHASSTAAAALAVKTPTARGSRPLMMKRFSATTSPFL